MSGTHQCSRRHQVGKFVDPVFITEKEFVVVFLTASRKGSGCE